MVASVLLYNKGMNTLIPILFAVPDDHVVDRKSSISQHTDKLGYWKKGQFIPLEFDKIDYIDCDSITSHRSTLSNGTDLGFDYPTGNCTVYSNNYLYGDIKEVVMRALPSWYGVGFYEAFVDKFTMINSSSASLGLACRQQLAVGLDYVKCKTVLNAVE